MVRHVDIVPLPRSRDWIRATPQVKRCLPVMMANQMGWGIQNPVGFTATWGGRESPADLVIKPVVPGEGPLSTSHFGSGIITFRVPLLVRTPPGWNLYVRGPSNVVKDGVVALEGLVETDWSVATFTQNWAMTRPGTVTFEEGELYCAFQPIRRDLIESVAVEVRDLDSDPALQCEHEAWARSRIRFRFAPDAGGMVCDAEGRPLASPKSTATWQKHYFQGVHVDGTAGAPDHQLTLDLAYPSEGQASE